MRQPLTGPSSRRGSGFSSPDSRQSRKDKETRTLNPLPSHPRALDFGPVSHRAFPSLLPWERRGGDVRVVGVWRQLWCSTQRRKVSAVRPLASQAGLDGTPCRPGPTPVLLRRFGHAPTYTSFVIAFAAPHPPCILLTNTTNHALDLPLCRSDSRLVYARHVFQSSASGRSFHPKTNWVFSSFQVQLKVN